MQAEGMTFDEAFERLIGHEGGFSDDPLDRGNWTGGRPGKGICKGTKYGISAAAYPAEDIQGMTLGRAKEIYLRDYWGAAGCDAVPSGVKFDLFDMAVNSGVTAAVKTLQRAVDETADGKLGQLTLQAVNSMNPIRTLARFNGARLLYITDAETWHVHGKGWARRIALNLMDV